MRRLTFGRRPGEFLRLFTAQGEIVVKVDSVGSRRATVTVEMPETVCLVRGEVTPDPEAVLQRLAANQT